MRWLRLALVGAALVLGGASGVAPASGQSANKQVNVVGPPFAFSPGGGSIASGQTILWENQTETAHTATSSEFNASIPAGSGRRSAAVPIVGGPRTIDYHCSIHPEMTGTLQVTAGGPPPAPPPPPPPPPPAPAATSTTRRPTATTARGAATTRQPATTVVGDATSTTVGFGVLAPTTTSETTSTTAGQVAIKEENDDGGGTSGVVIAALLVPIAAVLGGGGYALYRLRAGRS